MSHVRNLHEFAGDNWNRADLLREFAHHQLAQGYKVGSVQVACSWCKRYLRWLAEKGFVLPAQWSLDLPRQHVELQYVPEEADVERFLLAAKKLRDPVRTLVCLLPLTGLRESEARSLLLADWRNNTPDGRVLFLVRNPKNGRDREVPMLRAGNALLASYLEARRKLKSAESPLLFPGPKGNEFHSTAVESAVRDLRQQLNLPKLTCHSLRRFYATYCVDVLGLDTGVVAKLIGHSNMGTFSRYYQPSGSALARHMSATR